MVKSFPDFSVNKRKGSWKAISKILTKVSGNKKDWNKHKKAIEKAGNLISEYNESKNGVHKPFYDFILFRLQKRFKNEL